MATATRSSWRGAVDVASFPVNVTLYPRRKSRSADSFKMLGSDGMPVKQQLVQSDGSTIARDETGKGVMTGKDTFAVLNADAIESIKDANKSELVSPKQFAPLSTVPLELALQTYHVVPDKNVPGADQAANILWNGLRASGLAYCTNVTMQAGGRDSILVLYASNDHLYAASLPFEAELYTAPESGWEVDDSAAQVFQTYVESQEGVGSFDLGAHFSEYAERRQAAIDAAIAGKPVKKAKKAAPKVEVPSLLAAMAAQTKATTKRKAKA